MAELNLDIGYFSHRKTMRLIGLLGKGSEVLPIRLWCYTALHHAETGWLADYSAQEIESILGWWGEPGRMLEAMLSVKFIDTIDSGYYVHNWHKRAGHLIAFHIRAKKGARGRWGKIAGEDIENAVSDASSNACGEDKQCLKQCPNLLTNVLTNKHTPHKPPKGGRDIFSEAFAAFWKSYPRCNRKVGKPQCWRKWQVKKLDSEAEAVMSGLEKWKPVWEQDDGKFVPLPHRWLNEEWWKTIPKEAENRDSSWLDNPPGWQPRELEPEDIALITGKPVEEVPA